MSTCSPLRYAFHRGVEDKLIMEIQKKITRTPRKNRFISQNKTDLLYFCVAMKTDKYYWTNRASVHHIRRMASLVKLDASPEEILASGNPRYISHTVYSLTSNDGHRLYDFLIEYDIYNPSQGIYFGCKSVTLPGYNHQLEIDNALADWRQAHPLITLRLNNVFVDKDFTFRYKDTDNDTDCTFWPFWITLYEDELPEDVAVRALNIIAGVYNELISGQLPSMVPQMPDRSNYIPVRTAFTHQAFEKFLSQIEKYICEVSSYNLRLSNAERGRKFIKNFFDNAVTHGLIHRVASYECGWKLDAEFTDVDFKAMIKALIEEMQCQLGITGLKTPWNDVIRVFMRSNETPYKLQVKTLPIQHDTAKRFATLVHNICSNTAFINKE